MDSAWEQQNGQIVNLGHAMIGAVRPGLRAVSIEFYDVGMRLHFLLAEDSAVDREEIDDILSEFEALQTSNIPIDASIVVSADEGASAKLPGRIVFGRWEHDVGTTDDT